MILKMYAWGMLAVLAIAGCSSALGPEAETEEGFFFSGDIRLSYALDIPVAGATPYPIVVFGHDSGPNTKNEPNLKSPARRLAERGVAVFRFDKRGVGDSDGVYKRGFVDFELLSGDLVAAVEFVAKDPRVDKTRIGLMGSSQAGWILPMVATRSPRVAFVIIRSGPTVTVGQHNYWDETADDESLSIDQLSRMFEDFGPLPGDFDPRPFIEQMTMPTIWLFGRQDRIIPAPRSAEIIREIIAEFGRPFSVIIYPNGGHSLRDYWDDLVPWLDKAIGLGPTQQSEIIGYFKHARRREASSTTKVRSWSESGHSSEFAVTSRNGC
ncbi:MAG: alpha/beta hydrolase [Acidiferrobacterales bacterium]